MSSTNSSIHLDFGTDTMVSLFGRKNRKPPRPPAMTTTKAKPVKKPRKTPIWALITKEVKKVYPNKDGSILIRKGTKAYNVSKKIMEHYKKNPNHPVTPQMIKQQINKLKKNNKEMMNFGNTDTVFDTERLNFGSECSDDNEDETEDDNGFGKKCSFGNVANNNTLNMTMTSFFDNLTL